jgi:3'-5' exonuclease
MRQFIIIDIESAVTDPVPHQRYLAMERFVPNPDGSGRRGRDLREDPLLTPRWVFQTIVTAVAMVCVEHDDGNIDVVNMITLSAPECDERAIVTELLALMASLPADTELVSYGGVWHDTPVLTAAALRHGLTLPDAWLWLAFGGDGRVRHLDLCRLLTGNAKMKLAHLSEFAAMLDLPAKITQPAWAAARLVANGDFVAVQEMCEVDVITTALLLASWKKLVDEKAEVHVAHDRILRRVDDLRGYRTYAATLSAWRKERFARQFAIAANDLETLAPWLMPESGPVAIAA